jgi:hypothetical protein
MQLIAASIQKTEVKHDPRQGLRGYGLAVIISFRGEGGSNSLLSGFVQEIVYASEDGVLCGW